MFSSLLGVIGGGGGYAANAVDYNGSSDYLSSSTAFTGVDSTSFIFSAWIRLDGGNSTDMEIVGITPANGGFIARRDSANKISISSSYGGSSGATILSSSTYTSSATWLHILCSWNGTTGQLYINNSSDLGSSTGGGNVMYYSAMTHNEVARSFPSPSGRYFNGALSEIYFAPNQYLDFSNSANRAKFILAGKPVDLGSDGSTPTGVAPPLYMKNPAATAGTNSGTGGNLTKNGSPTTASTSPSD